MRTSVLLLASAVALSLVLPYCVARPGELYVKKQNSQQASASSAADQESSETVIKKGGCGCGGGGASYVASKKSKKSAAAASASSSSSSYEAKSSDSCKKELTVAEIKEKYCQQSGESLDAYYKRILARNYAWTSTTEAWVKTLSTVWENYSKIDLWYSEKYIDLTRDFYLQYFNKLKTEDWDAYYKRIITKKSWETDDLFARRILVVRDCFPKLDLWTSQTWYEKYTKSLYQTCYKKFESESEEAYIKRIFEKDSYFDVSDKIWAERIFLIQETFPKLDIWCSESYASYLSKFYKVYYAKTQEETCDGWLLRALSPLPGEDLDHALKRVTFLKKYTGDCGCWKSEYFKKIQQAKSLQECWLTKVQKAFFPCGCGGGAVTVQRSSSSKSSAAASATASESSESSKIVSA